MFLRKSVFEIFKISKNKIISFEVAKVLGSLQFLACAGAWGLGGILVSLLGCPQFRKIFSH
jgi:hypothetical protein